MRCPLWGLAVGLTFLLLAPSDSPAQVVNQTLGSDPFSLYYGWYLPNQAYQASQPRPQDTINANAVSRQYSALRDRGELFEPTSPFGGAEEGLEPFGPSSLRRGGQTSRASGEHIGNPRGAGPPEYYNRTARYFPNMRVGRGANRNIAVMRRGGMGPGSPTGGSGMPSMGGMR
jgi:hypothetical protein